jgi:hypothetical protein
MNEVLHQQWNVLPPLSQRRHFKGKDAQPIEQILPESAAADRIDQVTIRSGNDANVDVDRVSPPDALELPFLRRPGRYRYLCGHCTQQRLPPGIPGGGNCSGNGLGAGRGIRAHAHAESSAGRDVFRNCWRDFTTGEISLKTPDAGPSKSTNCAWTGDCKGLDYPRNGERHVAQAFRKSCPHHGHGGSIGREAALTFAREGALVVGCDLQADAAQATVEAVRAMGGTMVSLHPCRLSEPAASQALVDFAVHTFGRIDVLFNNAVMAYFNWLEDISDEEWDRNRREEVDLVFYLSGIIGMTRQLAMEGRKHGIRANSRSGNVFASPHWR